MPPEQRGGPAGAAGHYRALERLYASAAVNRLFPSQLTIGGAGEAELTAQLGEEHFHAAGAVHGGAYFKLLDDAAFYAVNSLVTDVFVLTTGFTLFLTRPLAPGTVRATGRWVSGHRRVLVAEARLTDGDGREVARGTGSFMRSRIALSSLPAYAGAQP